ncbi:MAG TPA: inner membrane CreD family protein, partial [Bryobacteraceae bacterium]|nr:inner membrane CreD family protein [Bryobacteraceae bacterium]
MVRRIVAIAFILVCTSIAWAVLGGTIFSRTYSAGPGLRAKVESSWGSPQKQRPPAATYSYRVTVKNEGNENGNAAKATDQVVAGTLPLESSHIDVNLHLDHRQKGLLWYSTYSADFSGAYTFRNDTDQARSVTVSWPFPAEKAVYDNLSLALDGRPLEFKNDNSQVTASVPFAAGETHALAVSYRSQGLDSWEYDFGSGVSQVRDFWLRMNTNFRDVDFAENSVSPTEKAASPGGWQLTWRYRNLVSGYDLAVLMPSKLQPGPLAGEISFFAPVSLFFFFFVMFIITTLRGVDLHPMNYFFLAAAFFAFHLLLAYLVDHLSIHIAFAVCSLVSIGLV